jgi:bifunctional N-acetylglucosamine-1-phosphate-uridyltransferase/glucosamine-1-phosphate-acetyltransferase GlmU-like protein
MAGSMIAVVPAAGRGSRLGTDVPKVMVEIAPGVRIVDVLVARLSTVVDRIHLVLSADGLAHFQKAPPPIGANVTLTASVQAEPRGMGDAVFAARDVWRDTRDLLVVWGDQLGLSRDTLANTVSTQRAATRPTITLPLVERDAPYVHYDFDPAGRLTRVLQSREGDICPPRGLSDAGLFALSTNDLEAAWARYLATRAAIGAHTRELNLLPFFAHLSTRENFAVGVIPVRDPDEARGVNTPGDLAWFRHRSTTGD